MLEITKQIKELEFKASKYDDLRNEVYTVLKEIFELTEQIQKKINSLDPTLKSTTRKYGKKGIRNERANEIYQLLKENDGMEVSINDISIKYQCSDTESWNILSRLKKMQGINSRLEGKRKFYYYHKPKVGKDETEIIPETKIPTKVSFMR